MRNVDVSVLNNLRVARSIKGEAVRQMEDRLARGVVRLWERRASGSMMRRVLPFLAFENEEGRQRVRPRRLLGELSGRAMRSVH